MVYVYPGLVIGAIYAMIGSSATLTYSTTGILNLGIGAMAYIVADLYYFLAFEHSWPLWAAVLVCVPVMGPAMGLVLWAAVFRRLERSNLVVQLVATIGLSVALPAIMQAVAAHDVVGQAPGIIPNGQSSFHLFFFTTTRDQLAAVLGAVVAVGALAVLLRISRFGLATRAVVDRPALAQGRGINPDLISALAWMLASLLVALSAVLLAPLVALNPGQYTALTISALSVALLGRFRSLWLTVVGGLALGVAESWITGEAPSSSQLLTSIGPALPFFVLVLLLLIGRTPVTSRRDSGANDTAVAASAARAAPSAPPPGAALRPVVPVQAKVLGVAVLGVGGAVALMFAFSDYWTGLLAVGTAYSVIFLSFTFATGEGGILCLSQAAIAGVGAFAAGRFASSAHLPIGLDIVLGMLAGTVVGFVVGAVGSRLDQIGFALMTLAFGLFCDQFAFNIASLVPSGGVTFTQFRFGSMSYNRSIILLNVVVFALAAGLLTWMRRGRVGRAYAAIRGNPVASESLGLGVRNLRTAAFTASAAVAGLGGVLLGFAQQGMSPVDVVSGISLVWVVVVVTIGVRGSRGALVAGLLFGIIPGVLALIDWSWIGNLPSILFGLGAVGLAQEPRGFFAQIDGQVARIRTRLAVGRAEVATVVPMQAIGAVGELRPVGRSADGIGT